MSRAIQIRVSESVVRTVHVDDGVESPLEMLPILAPDRMAELLAAELVALGFEREGSIARRTEADGIEISIDLERATVSVRLGASAELSESIERTATVAEERTASATSALRDDAIRDLEDRVEARTDRLRREVTRRLEQKLGDLRRELDGAIGRATVAALTEKAASLGQIESVVADEAGTVA
ncbi:MAG: hypothetical protein ACTHU0_17640, partial [Kofleriaceae bacterium]